jgi:hypothetical protein
MTRKEFDPRRSNSRFSEWTARTLPLCYVVSNFASSFLHPYPKKLYILSTFQNDAQFEILNETARALRSRNKMLKDLLSKRPGIIENFFLNFETFLVDPESVQRLQREINAIQIQVDIWIREISEIRENREQLDVSSKNFFSQIKP